MNVLTIPDFELEGLCHQNSKRYAFLLESVNNNKNNRYSILFAYPGEKIVLNHWSEFNFLTKLESLIQSENINTDINLPFTGGWFVYLSYELITQIEPTLIKDVHMGNSPIAIAVKIPCAIIKDHECQQTYLLDELDDQSRINQVLQDIHSLNILSDTTDFSGTLLPEPDEIFLSGVDRIKNYIKAGDVFQVNLSRIWHYKLDKSLSSTQVYKALKNSNPAPFSALAQFDNFSIVSSSPERLFSVDGDKVETRPIAGTHPRGSGAEDLILQKNLINHPKEQAEHIMILDLERNDLGRICKYGSIQVNEIMRLENYPYVHHIVSNIKGLLAPNVTIKHLVRALFPGGTITGCPKVRCMQIIAELEKMPREVYTGSLGYVSNNGKMDFNILIRTIVKQSNNLSFRAGAGIVFGSIAERELEETQYKAQGILKIFSR